MLASQDASPLRHMDFAGGQPFFFSQPSIIMALPIKLLILNPQIPFNMKKKIIATLIALSAIILSAVLFVQIESEKENLDPFAYHWVASFCIVIFIAGLFILILTFPKKQQVVDVKKDNYPIYNWKDRYPDAP